MGSFKHKKLFDFKKLPYKTVDGRRMYESPSGIQLPSITSILGWFKKESLKEWREKVGEEEANKLQLDKKDKVAYVTQTTLSLDDTKNIIVQGNEGYQKAKNFMKILHL